MAAAPVPIAVLAPAAPVFNNPLQLPAGHPLVAATANCIDWQIMPQVGGLAPHVSAPNHVMLHVFGIRFKFSPAPADEAVARTKSLFTLNFTAATWSRLLFQLHSSGLGLNQAASYPTVPHVHDAISKLTLLNPLDLNILAADWLASPALAALAGGAAAAVLQRSNLAEIRFLSVPLPDLEIVDGARAFTAPWAAISLLSGALGPVGTNAARLSSYPLGTATVVAAEIRGLLTASDAVLSASLKEVVVGALLPLSLRSHKSTPQLVLGELRAGLSYSSGSAGRQAVEEARVYLTAPWYCPAHPTRLAHFVGERALCALPYPGSQLSWAA